MLTRALACALFLILAACSPAPTESGDTPIAGSGESGGVASSANPDAAQLDRDVLPGRWFYGEGNSAQGIGPSAAFGELEQESLFQMDCNNGQIQFQYLWDETAPAQDEITIITSTATIVVTARGEVRGNPIVSGSLDLDDPRLDSLAQPQARFGAAIDGMVGVFPWEEGIARTLRACGV